MPATTLGKTICLIWLPVSVITVSFQLTALAQIVFGSHNDDILKANKIVIEYDKSF